MTNMTRCLSHFLIALLLIGSFLGLFQSGSGNAQAVPLSFLSDPVTVGYAFYKYDYEVIPSDLSANLTLYWTDATWAQLLIVNWHLVGFPNASDYGRVWMSLRLEHMGTSFAWQNFTIDVVALDVMLVPDYTMIIQVVLCMIIGFGLMGIGLGTRRYEFLIFSGFVWMFAAISVFFELGTGWVIITLGLGMFLTAEGALEIFNERKKAIE